MQKKKKEKRKTCKNIMERDHLEEREGNFKMNVRGPDFCDLSSESLVFLAARSYVKG
jgi:hypothetical protein